MASGILDLTTADETTLRRRPPRVMLANIFPFRPGEVVGPHRSASVLLLAAQGGRGRIGLADGEIPLEPGIVVVVPWQAARRYAADHQHPFRLICVHLVASVSQGLEHGTLDTLASPQRPSRVPQVADPAFDLRHQLESCVRAYARHSHGPFHDAILTGWGLCLATQVAALLSERGHDDHQPSPNRPPRLDAVASWMRVSFRHRISRSEIARRAGLSPSHCTTAFRRAFGCTPQAFLRELRLVEARRLLLADDRPVGEIAATVGFEDPLWFSRAFKARWGMSPQAMRRP
jgi:AraC-like DNA-binding protein/quercetin dioxygenase-like cupin family protein